MKPSKALSNIGNCRLCLASDIELRDSHYLPKAIYRQLRDPQAYNPNPYAISEQGSAQTARQLRAHLLCADCEERFSKHGENWVLENSRRADGTFKLASILAQHQPAVFADGNATKVYHAAGISEVDRVSLAYFAASIFWRGSIHGWNADRTIPVPLGPYSEQFRKFLLGEANFPEHVVLLLTVREASDTSMLTATPVGDRRDGHSVYKFPMPGLAFAIAVGKGMPAEFRKFCFVRGIGNPLSVTPLLEEIVQRDPIAYLQRHFAQRAAQGLRE